MPTSEPHIASVPRWKVIRDELCALIPQYAYGQRFCSIVEICEKYDVSTITARRALDELQAMGLVEKIRSRGTVVRQLDKTTQIRLVVPASIRQDYLSISDILRRVVQGVKSIADQQGVDFDLVSESHLNTLFDQHEGRFGFLLLHQCSEETINMLQQNQWAYLILNPLDHWKGKPHVRSDRYQAGYLGAKHLINLGHKRIGYILGAISRRHFRDRLNGYRAALKEAGIPFRWSLVHESDGEHAEQDQQAVTDMLACDTPPTAIMAGDDNRAIYILNTLQKRGIKVPEDISVLGYPNNPETRMTSPALSVIDARYELVGEAAMKMVLSQLYENANPAKQAVTMQPELLERESTAPPASTKIRSVKSARTTSTKTSRNISD